MTVCRIAHRGYAARHPENTVLALRKAAETADAVEFDLRRCGSGELVALHDETVDRVTDSTGSVDSFTAAELADLDVLGSGFGVPTLETLLEAIPSSVGVNAELKEPEIASDALRALSNARNDVLVSSFDVDVLETCRARLDEGLDAVSLAFLHVESGGIETAVALGCDAVHPRHDLCDGSYVDRARGRGLAVNAWTVDSASLARRLVDAGVDGLIVDDPSVFPTDEDEARRVPD